MLETGFRQFKLAVDMIRGNRMDTHNLVRLIDDARITTKEFGSPGAGARELLDGPFADPTSRRELSERHLRRTVRRLAVASPFYAKRLAEAGLKPGAVGVDTIDRVPRTTKAELVEHAPEFLCRDSARLVAARTTSTTGRAAEVWLSKYELDLWAGLGALNGIIRAEVLEDDLIHLHGSSRATASVHLTTAICRLVGAGCRVLGVIPVEEALDNLVGNATVLATSPSYLGDLVTAARGRGLTSGDFRLRRIDVGGRFSLPASRMLPQPCSAAASTTPSA